MTPKVRNIRKIVEVIKTKEHVNDYFDSLENVDAFSMSQLSYHCGTPSCIAGWAAFVSNPEEWSVTPVGDVVEKATEFLGLSSEESRNLFYPRITPEMLGVSRIEVRGKEDDETWTLSEVHLTYSSITPAEAIVTLENLIETGKVDWTHCSDHAMYVEIVTKKEN